MTTEEPVRTPEVAHVEWVDGYANVLCSCGSEDGVTVSFSGGEGAGECEHCGRTYTAMVNYSVSVWEDGRLVDGVDS